MQALPAAEPDDFPPVEHLDYDYVSSISDVKELRRIQEAVESKRFGVFPDLERHIEARLLAVMTPQELLSYNIARGHTPDEDVLKGHTMAAAYVKDLHSAEGVVLNKAGGGGGAGDRKLPPVRGAPTGSQQLGSSTNSKTLAPQGGGGEEGGGGKRTEAKAAPLASQYKKWSEFDVDKAITAADEEAAKKVRWWPYGWSNTCSHWHKILAVSGTLEEDPLTH